ncbi:hypothetical protein V3C99_012070 [Haemonchus contortus]
MSEATISHQAANLIRNMPSRISHISVFISVALIIVLIMVIAHITRLIVGMRSKAQSKSDLTPSAIVIQPKKKMTEKKRRKKRSLACRHRSNYNLPSKTMIIDIEVNREAIREEKTDKKKKMREAAEDRIKTVNLAAPPDYGTLQSSFPKTLSQNTTRTTDPFPAGASKAEGNTRSNEGSVVKLANAQNDGVASKTGTNGTIVSSTLKSETNASRSSADSGR